MKYRNDGRTYKACRSLSSLFSVCIYCREKTLCKNSEAFGNLCIIGYRWRETIPSKIRNWVKGGKR